MRSVLIGHARRYPLWAVEDLYKLLHQAAMGAEHALTDPAEVGDWLMHELAHLDAGPRESLIDPISSDGEVVRVHLRPFAALRLEQGDLVRAFIRTAAEITSSSVRLDDFAKVATQVAGEGYLPFATDQVRGYMAEQRARGFPAVHHSREYQRSYKPAYRVVARRFLPEEILAAARLPDEADPAGPG
ncbi:MAG: hypothetical protein ACM3KE_09730 [Hyphomicrobiales bacterium]